MNEFKIIIETFGPTVQVLSVVVGVVMSVLSFNVTRQKEAEARAIEAEKPLFELRRAIYIETIKVAAVIATPQGHSPEDIQKARRRFRELYVAELSMVEDGEVEQRMKDFAEEIDPELLLLTPPQKAALRLSHALRDSFISRPVVGC